MMASAYERRRMRLGLEDEPAAGVPQVGASLPSRDENEVVSNVLESKLNNSTGATGAVRTTQPVNRALSQKQPEREDVTRVGADDIGDDVDTGVGDDAGLDTGVDTTSQGGNAFERWGTENIPGAEDLAWGDPGRLRGFATNEWGQNREGYDEYTIKNSFGKIASRYDPTQPNAARTLMADPDFQRLFPEARLIEHEKGDQIDFGNGDPVDVLINAVAGGSGEAWAWQPASEQGGGGMDPMGGMGGGGITASMEGLTDSDQLAAILAQIDSLANGENAAETEALRRMLMQGGGGNELSV